MAIFGFQLWVDMAEDLMSGVADCSTVLAEVDFFLFCVIIAMKLIHIIVFEFDTVIQATTYKVFKKH